jgi:hypothetical protein
MAKKYVYQKNEHGYSDFVYVDLLPTVRRARQFNISVIAALLFAIVMIYVVIFTPYRQATIVFEEKNDIHNDLVHHLSLKEEEIDLHEINTTISAFEDDINRLIDYRVDFNYLIADVENEVSLLGGEITEISYSAEQQELQVVVKMTNFFTFSSLEANFRQLDWVNSDTVESTDPELYADVYYIALFTLEVVPNVE